MVVGFFFGGNAYAGSCEVPKILKTGKIYQISNALPTNISGTVLEIDDDSCWFKMAYTADQGDRKTQGTAWFNLATTIAIEEK